LNAACDGFEEIGVGGILAGRCRVQLENTELQVSRFLAQDIGAWPFAIALDAVAGSAFAGIDPLPSVEQRGEIQRRFNNRLRQSADGDKAGKGDPCRKASIRCHRMT